MHLLYAQEQLLSQPITPGQRYRKTLQNIIIILNTYREKNYKNEKQLKKQENERVTYYIMIWLVPFSPAQPRWDK